MCNTNDNSLSGNLLINLGSSQFQLAQSSWGEMRRLCWLARAKFFFSQQFCDVISIADLVDATV